MAKVTVHFQLFTNHPFSISIQDMDSPLISNSIITVFAILLYTTFCCSEQVLQTFTGEVGAGNYTYFTLKREGEITLILDSSEGDADIYISAHNPKPDFENYDLQSSTCGRDIVTIPKEFERPIGIAVYGHVYSKVSKYTMTVVVDYVESYGRESQSKVSWLPTTVDENGEPKEESVLWMLFVGIIKIIFEILV